MRRHKPITVGTLVRVRTDVELSAGDRAAIATGGLLWVCAEGENANTFSDSESGNLLRYTSLATGEEYPWFDNEVEVPEDEEQADD